jgi:hypothetical protein
MTKKYLLGAGMSALVFAYYNPGYRIISPEVGGKLSQSFMKNTIYLHESPEAIEFLNEVGIPFTKRTHTIKYCKGGVIQREIYMLDKIAFIKKKMNDVNFEVKDSTLSTRDYYQSVLQFDWQELIKKLSEKIEIISEEVIRITDKEIITNKTSYEYDEIVSTIPAPVFWKLYHQSKNLEFKSLPVTFALADSVPGILVGTPFDLLFFIDNKYKFNKINCLDGQYLYEFSGELTQDEVKACLPKGTTISGYYVDKEGIIITNKDNTPPMNIRFLGRLAEYDHSVKINDIIKSFNNLNNLNDILNLQKDFFDEVDKFYEKYKIFQERLNKIFKEKENNGQ